MANSFQLMHKRIWASKVFLNLPNPDTEPEIHWNIAGLMQLKKDGDLLVGIQARSGKEEVALFEVKGLFALADFDENDKSQVDELRILVFGFLFPYIRALVDQAFALAKKGIEPFPVIYVPDFFGKVFLTKED